MRKIPRGRNSIRVDRYCSTFGGIRKRREARRDRWLWRVRCGGRYGRIEVLVIQTHWRRREGHVEFPSGQIWAVESRTKWLAANWWLRRRWGSRDNASDVLILWPSGENRVDNHVWIASASKMLIHLQNMDDRQDWQKKTGYEQKKGRPRVAQESKPGWPLARLGTQNYG